MTTEFDRLDQAILRTLLYADVFDFPMTTAEVHHYLIETQATLAEVEHALQHPSAQLRPLITSQQIDTQMYFAINPRAEHVFATRQQRENYSQKLWPHALRYGHILSALPFVKMVCLTGALSVRNPGGLNDDLDYFLVVQTGRVWTARFMAVILVRLAKLWGMVLCPNYVLGEEALVQSKQDSFIAHEIAQMQPIYGKDLYLAMRTENEWAQIFLPNATQPFYESMRPLSPMAKVFKHIGEFALKGWLGDKLENWESRRKIVKLQRQIDHNSAAQLDKNHVKGHFQDHGLRILHEFYARLDTYGLPYPALQITDFSRVGESAAD